METNATFPPDPAGGVASYRDITDHLPLGIALLDRDLRILSANPCFLRWFPESGQEPAPVWHGLFPDLQVETTLRMAERPLNQGTTQEFSLRTEERAFRITFSPVRGQDGDADKLLAIVNDVTETQDARVQLLRAQRLEALGTLAGGIAHEINQPLNALQLYTSGLEMLFDKQADVDRETIRTRLGWMLAEIGKIRDIISHMRALVRQENASPHRADMNQAVRSALALVGAQLKNHGIEIRLDLTDGLPWVAAGEVQLEQVCINLAINAMHALDGLEQESKFVEIATGLDQGKIRLAVADNGPGFQNQEGRIFDPFFTTKDAGQGMGLGLSIVHTFVRAWDGEVSAAGNVHGGATVTVLLNPYQDQPDSGRESA